MAAKEVTTGQLRAWVHEAQGVVRGRVVLVHGLGEHSGRHAVTAERIAGAGFEAVRFDLRGSGLSGGVRQWIDRFDDYIDDTRSIIRWAQSTRAPLPLFLFGHSLGGAIALRTAALEPPKGIVLCAPAYLPGGGVSPVKIFVGRIIERIFPKLRIPGSLDVAAISRDAAEIAAFRADPLNCSFNTVRQGNEILKALAALPEACRKITAPILIAHGDQDRLIKVEGSQILLDAIPSKDKTLKIFPGAFHELHNDLDREAFFSLVTDWLRQHAGTLTEVR